MRLEDLALAENLARPVQNRFFDGLVRNAIDFLTKSVDDLEKSPKYSVIHFYAAIELFVKARLLAEHWTLIIADINRVPKKQGETILSQFEGGNLNSAGLDKCIERLRETCGVKIPAKAREYFDKVRKHRNKLVHFFHPDYSEIISLTSIITEQWSAWYYLHRLVCDDWEDYFSDYHDEIEDVHSLICGNWKYFEAKFKEIQPDIEEEKQAGITFNKCSVCGYEAARLINLSDIIFSHSCIVCHNKDNEIHVACPDCDNEIIVVDQAIGICSKCGFETDFEFLFSGLAPYQDPKEDSIIAYCAQCEYPRPSVIPMGEYDEKGLCLNCNTLHESKGNCRYCGELIAGMDLGNSYVNGCIFCGGLLASDNS
jgi:hypothetical protein